jgi:hypothetical protein
MTPSTTPSLLFVVMSENAMTLYGSYYCRCGKAKDEIVGGHWIIPDKGLTD